jgi:hypothetical protein
MSDILEQLKRRTAQELEKRVNAQLPTAMHLNFAQENPEEDDDDEEDDEYDDEDEDEGDDEEDDGDGEEAQAVAFEDAEKEHNLACAAAAYRICGCDGYIVATHSTGPAFFGDEDQLDEYSKSKDLSDDGWEVYSDSEEILDLPYDHDAMKRVIGMIEQRESQYKNAEDFYQKFHWGNPSNVQVVKNIPGVSGTLVHLGVARRVDYGANKNNDWAEYYHMFGENTNEYPSLYALMNEGETEPTCLLIHGGNMRVEPRGVVE